MMRYLLAGLTLAILACATAAQIPGASAQLASHQRYRDSDRGDPETWVSLGERLFFDARLSGTGRTACASCHDPAYAFAEPRRTSDSDGGRLGRRNAPSLLDVGLRPILMWDGRFPTLEHQALSPFQRGEMGIGVDEAIRRVNADPAYVHLYRELLGRRPSAADIAHALAAFQRTLISTVSRVDRFLATGERLLTRLEYDGFRVFTERAACGNCHELFPARRDGRKSRRPLFTDFRFHNLGIGFRSGRFADTGRYELTGDEEDVGAFRTPSLRNAARSAPYMHDGSLPTLEVVVEFYNAGGRPNPNLSPLIRPLFLADHEKAALVAFLYALTEDDPGHHGRQSRR
jgi:cytochrome c peroxidase